MANRFRKDPFSRKAKEGGYVARSVFKLETVDRKIHLIRPGNAVLDLGCHPGSWLQYCAERIGKTGTLVAVDRRRPALDLPAVHFIQANVLTMDPKTIQAVCSRFDVVLSDLAPDTSGDRFVDGVRSYELSKRAMEIALAVLKPKGRFFCKIFQSQEFNVFLTEARRAFKSARVFKPPSSRKESREVFVLGMDVKI